MAFSFDQIFAADPANPQNVASNAAVLIYTPGDPTKAPLTITDPSGGPLANPVIVNANGFGSAFMHATLDRVAWDGGGFSGFFTSYEGMKNVSVAAQAAAEAAAATAGVDAAAVATAAIGDATADADAAATSAATAATNAAASASAAATSASLVGAPADTAMATVANNTSSAFRGALNATFVPKWKATTAYLAGDAVLTPAGDTVTAKVNFTSGASFNAANWNYSPSYAGKVAKGLAAPTDGPVFVKQGTAQLTQANSGLASIYWPYVVNVEHISGALGKFYMYYSTDHDLGAGGIKMAYANSPTGPWTKHPTFSYIDAVSGDQTETPSIIWNEDTSLFHLYYQQEGTGLNQSTFLATSPDGITFTRVGMVIQGIVNIPGDGQTTYLRPFRAGGQWIGYHLFGGGNYGHGGISYSQDGITWVTEPRRLGYFNDLIGDATQRIDLFHAVPFQWRGQTWALAQMGPHVGGFVVGGAKWVLGRLSPDFRSFIGKPKQIFATLPGAETETNGPTSVVAYGNSVYTYYRANGAQGDFRVAIAEA